MDLNNLDYFIAIGEALNLSAAAARLYVTQPALSHYLAKLERQLDTKLVIRGKGAALRLTPEGERYLSCVREIKRLQTDYLRWLEDQKESPDQMIRIGITGERDIEFLEPFLQELSSREPQVRLKVIDAPAEELESGLSAGELDIGYFSKDAVNTALHYTPLQEGEVYLMMRRTHPLSAYAGPLAEIGQHVVPSIRLQTENIILIKKGTVLHRIVTRYLEAEHCSPTIKAETSSTFESLFLAASQDAVGFCPQHYAKEDARLVYARLSPPMTYTTGIFVSAKAYSSRAVRSFMQIVKEHAAGIREGKTG